MIINDSKAKHKEHEAAMGYWPGAFDDKYDDTKRHFKILETVLPIVMALQPKTILTIGDNRGRDAAYFRKMVGCHSIASDLDISKLIPAKNDGFIDDCKIIDVEKIDYPDNSIDIVVVKESFHHWPRPMLGFYEVLRIAKCGVILIEPNDFAIDGIINPYVQESSFSDWYEKVGNFAYKISLREILKSSWALYLDTVLAKGLNDPYSTPFYYDDWIVKKNELDELGKSGLRQFNLMAIFVEKEKNSIDISKVEGFKIYKRPINPFIEG